MNIDYQDRHTRTTLDRTTTVHADVADTADEAAIHALYQQLLHAWGRGDGHAYAALFTEDADYVPFDGSHTKGRQAIATSHQQLFDRWLKGTRLVGQITSLQFLNADVAIVHATGSTVFPGEAKPRPSRDSIQTLIATKRNGTWCLAAFHNTRIQRRSPLQWLLFAIATRFFRR